MNQETNPIPGASIALDEKSKYGVPSTVRLSAHMRKILGDEAALRGLSFSQYGVDLMLTAHKNSADQTAELNMLIRERDLLNQKVVQLTGKLQEKETESPVLASINKNREILKQHAGRIVTKEFLEKEGFDFRFMTHAALENEKQLYCVLDMAYAVEKETITIKSI
jgi:hypothetical protein